MSEIKNGGLDQYGAEPFEQQQFGPAGIEGVNPSPTVGYTLWPLKPDSRPTIRSTTTADFVAFH